MLSQTRLYERQYINYYILPDEVKKGGDMSLYSVASRSFHWSSPSVDQNRGVADALYWLFAAMSTALLSTTGNMYFWKFMSSRIATKQLPSTRLYQRHPVTPQYYIERCNYCLITNNVLMNSYSSSLVLRTVLGSIQKIIVHRDSSIQPEHRLIVD